MGSMFNPATYSFLPLASGGSFLITPNVGLMVWTLVVFLISFFVLRKWVFPVIGNVLDSRAKRINDSIDAAEHTTQFARWRPDREPRSCTYAQLEEPVSFDLGGILG